MNFIVYPSTRVVACRWVRAISLISTILINSRRHNRLWITWKKLGCHFLFWEDKRCSLSLSMSVSLSVSFSLSLSVSVTVSVFALSVCLFVCPSVCRYVCRSVCLSFSPWLYAVHFCAAAASIDIYSTWMMPVLAWRSNGWCHLANAKDKIEFTFDPKVARLNNRPKINWKVEQDPITELTLTINIPTPSSNHYTIVLVSWRLSFRKCPHPYSAKLATPLTKAKAIKMSRL